MDESLQIVHSFCVVIIWASRHLAPVPIFKRCALLCCRCVVVQVVGVQVDIRTSLINTVTKPEVDVVVVCLTGV